MFAGMFQSYIKFDTNAICGSNGQVLLRCKFTNASPSYYSDIHNFFVVKHLSVINSSS